MKKECAVILCTALILSFGILTCSASPAGTERPVFSLAPEFLQDNAGEFMFHSLAWESTVEETEAGLGVLIGEPDFVGPDYLPTKNTRYFRNGEFSFPFLESHDSQTLEYYYQDGKLQNVEVTIYRVRGMSQDMVYENLMQLYLDAFGEPFEQSESNTIYTVEPSESMTLTTMWISDPSPDGMVSFCRVRTQKRESISGILITLGLIDFASLTDREHHK